MDTLYKTIHYIFKMTYYNTITTEYNIIHDTQLPLAIKIAVNGIVAMSITLW